MKQELSRREILEMIAGRRLSSDEAFKLLKEAGNPGAEPLEEELAVIVAEILSIERDKIDPEGDIKDFGFDSLTLTSFADRIARTFNVEIMPTLFFELDPPTLSSLAARLRRDFPGKFAGAIARGLPAAERNVESFDVETKESTANLVAIIGMSGTLPQADDLEEFWDHLVAGHDLISEATEERWDWRAVGGGEAARWGGFMRRVDGFDADFFGISPREARLMDPQQRLFLETVWHTIEDAGYKPSDLWGSMTGLFVGVSSTDYIEVLQAVSSTLDPHMATGMSHSILANRVSFMLNLHGPSQPIDTACSSSLVAIGRAIDCIRAGSCTQAIAGGVNVMLSPKLFLAFSAAGMLAKDGRCKTFDQKADGYVRGEGVGAVFLKPLALAEAEGDHIYAVIIGAGENHGGHAHSLTAPNANAQAALIADTYRKAGIDPATVNYIETHGTGTNLGDPVEINGLKKAFDELFENWGKPIPQQPLCGLGSVKTVIGHLETAAGIASVLKVLLALKYEKFPANCHFQTLNPYLDLQGSPFYIVDNLEKWPSRRIDSNGATPRRAGISSFGFGGSNAHIVLEEYIDRRVSVQDEGDRRVSHLVVLSAKNRERLIAYCRRMIGYLERHSYIGKQMETIAPRLQTLLASVLGVGEGDIGAAEDLAEFGLDQIALTEFTRRINEVYDCRLSAQEVINHANLEELAVRLDGRGDALSREVEVDGSPTVPLRDIAFTLQVGREAMPDRLAVIAGSVPDLLDKLNRFCRGESASGIYVSENLAMVDSTTVELNVNALSEKDLDAIAHYYVSGGNPDWRQLYSGSKPVRVPLPTYPFQHERFWIETASDSGSGQLQLKSTSTPPRIYSAGPAGEDLAPVAPILLKAGSAYVPQRKPVAQVAAPATKNVSTSAPAPVYVVADGGLLPARIKEILAEVLMTAPNKIDEAKAFIDLGLDSILGVEFTKKINETFGMDLKATKLYDYSTIGALAAYIGGLTPASDTSKPPRITAPAAIPAAATSAGDVTRQVRTILAGVLFTDPSRIDDGKSFIDLGLDSILGVEFTKKINEAFFLDIKATKLYDHSTVNALSAFIAGQRGVPAPAPATTAASPGGEISDLEYFRRKYMGEDSHVPATAPVEPGVVDLAAGGVAVIGMSARFPGADDIWQYWENLAAGVDSVTEVPADRWDVERFFEPGAVTPGKTFCKWGGFLRDVDKFDPLFFTISPLEAEALDPQQRLFLQEAWRALENAGYSPASLDNKRCGVFVGVMSSGEYATGSMYNASSILAARISYFLNLRGPAVALDTACSSSLVAMHLACKSLANRETDMMLVGGVSLYLTEKPYVGMCQMGGILSPDGKCKTFDNSADGFVPGEGVGVLVLKLVDRAMADGDTIFGVVKGSGINQDGRTNGITAPSAESQKDLELEVYRNAGIDPASISYVETHGTGTKLGDPIEIEALTGAFRQYTSKTRFCPVGSVKTNLGHTSAAAGVASVIKVLLSMKHRQIPPSLHFKQTNEHIDFDSSPFYVNDRLCPWTPPAGLPMRAAVSSFGYSGTNAHLVIDEAPSLKRGADGSSPCVAVALSAKKERSLVDKIKELSQFLARTPVLVPYTLQDLAYTLATGRQHFDYRISIVTGSLQELQQALKTLESGNIPANCFDSRKKESGNAFGSGVVPPPDERMAMCLAMAEAYVNGHTVDWSLLFGGASCRRVPLPGYPFLKDRYWMERMDAAPALVSASQGQTARPLRAAASGDESMLRQVQEDLKRFMIDLLKVKEGDIDIDGEMSEYGFDSITFTDYVKRINQCYGIEYAVESFFDLKKPTIRSLGDSLAQQYKQRLLEHFNVAAEEIPVVESNVAATPVHGSPVAIIGIGGILGSADNPQDIWKHIAGEAAVVGNFPAKRASLTGNQSLETVPGGYLPHPDMFDAEFFGIPGSEAELMDPQQRVFLEIAWQALEDAGYKPSSLAGSDTGVFVGATQSGYNALTGALNTDPLSMVAHRVSYLLDLRGPSDVVDMAGAGSLAALQRACEALSSGRCSLAICGGIHLCLDPGIEAGDEPDVGIIPGEGVGVLVLKSLDEAVRDRDHVYAVIRDVRVNHGGRVATLTAPNPGALKQLLGRVYGREGVDPGIVDYVEMCGRLDRGTFKLEVEALSEALLGVDHVRSIGALYPTFGDLGNAAGVAGIMKIALAMRKGVVPPSGIPEEFALLVNGNGEQFQLVNEAAVGGLRRAGINAFGYGGAHAHAVLDAYAQEPEATDDSGTQVAILSARDSGRLRVMAERLLDYMRRSKENGPVPRDSGKSTNIRKRIEEDILRISSDTLVAGSSGFEAESVELFLRRVADTFGLELSVEEFLDQASVGTFIRYLAKNYKEPLTTFFQLQEGSGRYPFTLRQIAGTLQLGREEMAERLAIVADDLDELERSLDGFCRGEVDRNRVFTGNVSALEGHSLLLSEGEEKEEYIKSILKNRKYGKLAQSWVMGVPFDWRLLYDGPLPGRIPLPAYPFAETSYWASGSGGLDRKKTKSQKQAGG